MHELISSSSPCCTRKESYAIIKQSSVVLKTFATLLDWRLALMATLDALRNNSSAAGNTASRTPHGAWPSPVAQSSSVVAAPSKV
jgi:hypothetical protein